MLGVWLADSRKSRKPPSDGNFFVEYSRVSRIFMINENSLSNIRKIVIKTVIKQLKIPVNQAVKFFAGIISFDKFHHSANV